MLAQNFKTAADLGIKDVELDALIKVLGMLERGDIPAHLFDMMHVGEPECGTAGCILGWVGAINIHTRASLDRCSDRSAISELFYPGLFYPMTCVNGRRPMSANRTEAASALRSFLTTGEANWAEALA